MVRQVERRGAIGLIVVAVLGAGTADRTFGQNEPRERVSAAKEAEKAPRPAKAKAKAPPAKVEKPVATKSAGEAASGAAAAKPQGSAAPAEKPAAQTKSADRSVSDTLRTERLDEIERKLRALIGEVQELRRQPAPTAEAAQPASATTAGAFTESWSRAIVWRAIGPANMGGRIVDLAVYEADPTTFWVATASGGLLKTTNNGITFEHQFDNQATVSIGAVAVAPSDARVVWVGTGENNPRNSVSYGDGVYKSVDGGRTFTNVGLRKSFQIGRILIHPKTPDIVYVGALGRLYGPNEERGVFKTTDGGKSWQRLLYSDDKTGVIDMRMHPTNPDVLIAATWERQRDGFDSWPGTQVPRPEGYDGYDPIKKWGPGSGLFRTTDAGKTWQRITKGLPTSHLGRIGLDWHRKDPNIVYAIIDCANIGKGLPPINVYLGAVGEDVDGKARLIQVIPDSPAAKAGLAVGDVIAAVDDKPVHSFDEVINVLRERKVGQKVRLKVTRGTASQEYGIALAARPGQAPAAGVWLGVNGEDRAGRVHIVQALANGPAAKAGMRDGDVVVAADGKPVADFANLIELVRGKAAGETILLRIERGKETKNLKVVIEDRPGPRGRATPFPASNVYLGIVGADAEKGARMTQITENGPAEKAGLLPGDVVTAINGKPIDNYDALVQQIRARQPDDKLQLTVRRGAKTVELTATLAERPGGPSRARPYFAALAGQMPNVQDQQGAKGFEYGGVYRSNDGGESWTRVNSLQSRPMYFSVVRVDPNDPNNVYALGVAQYRSANGGATFDADFGRGCHADGHALWIDPRDGRHMILGTDGGTYVTYDRGANWDHLNHTAIGQFYHVAIAPKEPYHLTGGLQDNGTWFGPSLSKSGAGPINEDWIAVGGGDGFVCRVDPDDPDLVYYTSQNGNMRRRNLRTGQEAAIRPTRLPGGPGYRFNWNAPFILSAHNPRIFYGAGNFVFRSLNRGDHLQIISPEITLTQRGSATALAESPRNPNLLYAGTDDGGLWVTQDGGRQWAAIHKHVGLPGPRWVATIEASRFAEGRVYVAFDGHRSDDDEPHVYVSDDFGKTWQSLRANLPWGSTRTLREDVENQNLLFVGTEFGAWFSLDRGKRWNELGASLPTVAVHEFALHPKNGELAAATHGRSLWICDVSALRQINPEHLAERIGLYKPSTVIRWRREPYRGRTNRRFVGSNPPAGAVIYYSLPTQAEQVSLRIVDIDGTTLRQLPALKEPGLHRVVWDLTRVAGPLPAMRALAQAVTRRAAELAEKTAATKSAAAPPQPAPAASRQRTAPPRPVPAGTYRVLLTVDGKEWSQTLRVVHDPTVPVHEIVEPAHENTAEVDEAENAARGHRWIDD